ARRSGGGDAVRARRGGAHRRLLGQRRDRQHARVAVPLRAAADGAVVGGVLPGRAVARGAATARLRHAAVARGGAVPGRDAGSRPAVAGAAAPALPGGVAGGGLVPGSGAVHEAAGGVVVVTLLLARAAGSDLSLRRAVAVTERNLVAFRHASYWVL